MLQRQTQRNENEYRPRGSAVAKLYDRKDNLGVNSPGALPCDKTPWYIHSTRPIA